MTISYDRILVAIDGSDEAGWAFRKSIGIAQRNNAELHLVHVLDTRSLSVLARYDSSYADRAEQEAEDMLKQYREQAEAAGLQKVNTIVTTGTPKTSIARTVAKQVNADLIVCGATGMGPIAHFLLGSVSEHIVRTSRCDVLVVRTEEHAEANS